jgi:hypothetical protein
LAFISEFYVQMLYLPDLKNVVADFLPRPNQTTTGSVASASAGDPVDFEEMAAEQNCCPETQRLLGCTSLKLVFARQALNTWLATLPQAIAAAPACEIAPLLATATHAAPLDGGSGTPSGQVS